MRARAAAAMIVMSTVSWSSCFVSGVFSCSTPLSIPEMCPTSLDIPVAVTTISPRPRVHLGVHVRHVDAIAERRTLRGHRVDHLRHRRALAREAGLLDLERRGDQDPAVGGHLVAGLEPDDVAGDQLLGRDLDALAVAPHVRRHDQHLAQRGDALGGLALLVQAHHRVEDGQPDHDQPGRHVLQRDDADHRGAEQHELHQVAVLAQERLPTRLLGLLGQPVRPVLAGAAIDLGGVETDAPGRRRARWHTSSADRRYQSTASRSGTQAAAWPPSDTATSANSIVTWISSVDRSSARSAPTQACVSPR